MTADQLKLKVNGVEDTVFESPRREIPAEAAVQQSCNCPYDCYQTCRYDCVTDCASQCGGYPDVQADMSSMTTANMHSADYADLRVGIM